MTTSTFQTPNIPNRKLDKRPDLAKVLESVKDDVMYSLNCHAVGTVQSFNSENQTATVQINYLRTAYVANANPSTYTAQNTPYPLLIDCPVIVLSGGVGRLTFPISAGDVCLVLFNDRSLDNWFQSGQVGPLNTLRAHSLSDGIALIGLSAAPRVPEGYDEVRSLLTSGVFKAGVGPAGVYLADAATTLGVQLQNLTSEITSLITAINTLVTATASITVLGVTTGAGTSGLPANAAVIAAIATTLTTISGQVAATAAALGGLLE